MSDLSLSFLTVINWFTIHSRLSDYSLQSLLIIFFSISVSPFRVVPSLIFFNIFLLETFPSFFLSNVSSSPSAAITIKDIDWVSRYIDPLILRCLAQDHRMRIDNITYRDSLTASIFLNSSNLRYVILSDNSSVSLSYHFYYFFLFLHLHLLLLQLLFY